MYKAKVTEGFGLTHWHANTDVPCAYPLGPREYSPSVRASVTTRTPCTMSKPARIPNFASAAVAVAAACGLASAMSLPYPWQGRLRKKKGNVNHRCRSFSHG